MVYKFFKYISFLLIINFFNSALNSEIIYDKNQIIITNYDLALFQEYYLKFNGSSLNKDKAIKEIILSKKLTSNLKIKNPTYLYKLDEVIKSEFPQNFYNEEILLNLIRYLKTRNEFFYDYVDNELTIEEFYNFLISENIKLTISNNGCFTIIDQIYLNENFEIINKLYNKIMKKKDENLIINIRGNDYEICINSQTIKKIENIVYQKLDSKINTRFKSFIYGK